MQQQPFTRGGAALTKSDSASVTTPHTALYVGGAGDLNVILANDGTTETLFKAVPVGTILPIQIKKLMSTSTTATLVVPLL